MATGGQQVTLTRSQEWVRQAVGSSGHPVHDLYQLCTSSKVEL